MKFDNIQVLRFIAAVFVVAYHAHQTALRHMPGHAPMPLLGHGFYGVDLFFVISGFIIYSPPRGARSHGRPLPSTG